MSIRFTSFGFGQPGSKPASHSRRPALYCFPNAGGGAALYRALAAKLCSEVDVRAALLPGRDGRFGERGFETWTELASAGASAIRAEAPARYALMGHSMGALVAFEVARALRRDAFAPAQLLVASGRVAPRCRALESPVAHLSDEQLARAMVARSGGVPPEVLADRETLALFMPVLRGDMLLLEQYRYREGVELDIPLLVLAGRDDPLTTLEQARAWREHTSAGCHFECFSGDHWFIRTHTVSIARTVSRQLGLGGAASTRSEKHEPS